MSKVDWITWKTDVREIVNPKRVNEKIEDEFQNYNVYMNSVVYEGMNHEIQTGGLDNMSLNLFGTSPANEQAIEIINRIDEIKSIMENLKIQVYNELESQKETEKSQLIQAIEEKVEEEEKKLENTIALKERLGTKNNVVSIQEVDDIIDITKDRIKKLQERLESAKTI